MSEEDIRRLNKFIFNVREDIDLLVRHIDILMPELPEQPELQDLMTRAWKDVSPRFEEVSLYILGEKKLEGLQKQLEDRGLTGIQLEFKLAVYEARREEFHRRWDRFLDSMDRMRSRRTFRVRLDLLKRAIGWLLGATDIFLDSLGLIPGADAIKEFKAFGENLLS